MAIAVSGTPVTQRQETATTSHSVAAPSGSASGDTVYLGIVLGLGSGGGTVDATMSAPSGWTTVAGPVQGAAGAVNIRVYMFRRRLTGGGDDTFAGSTGATSAESLALSCAYSGVDATTPEDVAASTQYEGFSTGSSYPLAGVTLATTDAWLVGFWALLTGSGTITVPGGMTQRVTDVYTGGYRTLLADEGPLASGATGTRAASGNADREWAGALVALRPAAGGGPPQVILPDADLATTGWTTAPLFSKINDSSDATVVTGALA